MLRSLYPKAVDIAKSITGKENTTEAVKSFRQFINSPSMYFNEQPFPKNESDERAYRKCNSVRGKLKRAMSALYGNTLKFTNSTVFHQWKYLQLKFHETSSNLFSEVYCELAMLIVQWETQKLKTKKQHQWKLTNLNKDPVFDIACKTGVSGEEGGGGGEGEARGEKKQKRFFFARLPSRRALALKNVKK